MLRSPRAAAHRDQAAAHSDGAMRSTTPSRPGIVTIAWPAWRSMENCPTLPDAVKTCLDGGALRNGNFPAIGFAAAIQADEKRLRLIGSAKC